MADDIPELTVVLKTESDMHFDSTFDPQKMSVHTWPDTTDWDYIPNDENKHLNVEILVKDGQGASADGTTFTFTVRYPKVDRLAQTITVDTTARTHIAMIHWRHARLLQRQNFPMRAAIRL